jgi:hypothetical protein
MMFRFGALLSLPLIALFASIPAMAQKHDRRVKIEISVIKTGPASGQRQVVISSKQELTCSVSVEFQYRENKDSSIGLSETATFKGVNLSPGHSVTLYHKDLLKAAELPEGATIIRGGAPKRARSARARKVADGSTNNRQGDMWAKAFDCKKGAAKSSLLENPLHDEEVAQLSDRLHLIDESLAQLHWQSEESLQGLGLSDLEEPAAALDSAGAPAGNLGLPSAVGR